MTFPLKIEIGDVNGISLPSTTLLYNDGGWLNEEGVLLEGPSFFRRLVVSIEFTLSDEFLYPSLDGRCSE